MEQVPRADRPPVGECSTEQATREHNGGDLVVRSDAQSQEPIPFAVPERLAVVDSTSRYLARLASNGLGGGAQVPNGYAVVADHQTDGRGRLGRSWVAPPGTSVLCSILLKPDLGPEQLHLAAWAVALAAVRACRATAGAELALKWPNDLIAGTASGGEAPEPLRGPRALGARSPASCPRSCRPRQGATPSSRSAAGGVGSSWASGST